jgi:DNA-binding transcriptional LysR family regulator
MAATAAAATMLAAVAATMLAAAVAATTVAATVVATVAKCPSAEVGSLESPSASLRHMQHTKFALGKGRARQPPARFKCPARSRLSEAMRPLRFSGLVDRESSRTQILWTAGRVWRAACQVDPMDRVSSMISFVNVVKHGGFSPAARKLNMATSVVTTHVKSLEDRLGVRLLNRTTRNVSLTEVGQDYYERCVQILSEIEDAEEAAQVLQSKPRGVLRLNLGNTMADLIAPSIAEFTDLYPEVSIRATETVRMVDLVEEGFDLSIRPVSVGHLSVIADSRLVVRRLAEVSLVVCGSPEYLARRGRPEHPADLVRHSCLHMYDVPWGNQWHFAGPNGQIPVRISASLEANSNTILRRAAVLGQGLIYVTTYMVADELRCGELVPLLTEFLPDKVSISALYPHREHLPAKVRSFIDLVAKNLPEAMPDACPSTSA